MKSMQVQHDNGSFALIAPDYVNTLVLAPGVAKSMNVPAGGVFAAFSSNTDFYASYKGTATVPSNDVTDGTGCELNPTVRYFGKDVSALSLISPAGGIVTIAFYKQ